MCSLNLGAEWHISPQGINIISENNTITDRDTLLKNALNADLKEVGLPILSKELSKPQISQLILQIQKIRNVSAPKANEDSQAAPRMLKFVLTDGDSYVQAIENSLISTISREKTPPGSKLLLKNVKITNGFLLLNSNNTKLLGGKVPHLFDKWEVAKSVQHFNRLTATSDGPPAWVNFGCKISTNTDEFKSLEKMKETKENSEFETLRQGAIAEASTGAVKKIFGGGVKQSVQTYNNRNDKFNKNSNKYNKKELKNGKDKEIDDRPSKPSDKVSLFDFLEDKLNITTETTTTNTNTKINSNDNQQSTTKSWMDNKKSQFPKNNYQRKDYNNFDERKYTNKEHFYGNKRNEQINFKEQQFMNKKEKKNDSIKYTRNETERSKDNWHYRAPDKLNNVTNVENLTESISKISMNSEFASRSLRQHLNLEVKKPSYNNVQNFSNNKFNVGDECLVKYWEDGKFYPAKITASTDTTYVVQFKGYGNIEEVLKNDCVPFKDKNEHKRHFKGSLEFRRNPKKFSTS